MLLSFLFLELQYHILDFLFPRPHTQLSGSLFTILPSFFFFSYSCSDWIISTGLFLSSLILSFVIFTHAVFYFDYYIFSVNIFIRSLYLLFFFCWDFCYHLIYFITSLSFFIIAGFIFLSDNTNIYVLSDLVFVGCLSPRVEIFLIIFIMSNFGFNSAHFEYYVKGLSYLILWRMAFFFFFKQSTLV